MSTPLKTIHSNAAPAAIGPYSQAVQAGNMVFISGQIPLLPETMEIAGDDIESQTRQVFENLTAIIKEAGGSFTNVVKLTIYMIDLGDFAKVNDIMTEYFEQPFPARATIQVSALPKSVKVEIDAILAL